MINKGDLYRFKFHKDFREPIFYGYKKSTIRDKPKPVDIYETVFADFQDNGKYYRLEITGHYAVRVKDINEDISKKEGYLHPDLLRHELYHIYPDLKPDDYVYVYEFKFKGIKNV